MSSSPTKEKEDGKQRNDDATKDTNDPANKRRKRDILRLDISTTNNNNNYYYHADPFPHVIIPNVFTEDFLATVITEIKDHSTVDFKESDLFKVFQSMDLGGGGGGGGDTTPLPPAVQQLRDTVYSAPWRQWIAEQCHLHTTTTTTAALAAQPLDCAVNAHAKGCHLLCHDDAMRTRRVSFVLYLTDPHWNVETDGGGLELYDVANKICTNGTSTSSINPIPCKVLSPTRNQLVVFPVEPGVSLHAVQEVRREASPRLALQGWYHYPTTEEEEEGAMEKPPATKTNNEETTKKGTLEELKEAAPEGSGEAENYTPLEGLVDTDDDSPTEAAYALTDDDRAFLQQWINPAYLTETSLQELRERFDADSAIQLHAFLQDDKTFSVPTEDDDDTNPSDFTYGVTEEWETVGPPHKQRYLAYTLDTTTTATEQPQHPLATIRNDLLTSPAFAKYLYALTSLTVRGWHAAHLRRFRRGRDYTVAHHGQLLDYSVLDATVCFVQQEDNDNSNIWSTGDVGGYDCYTAAVEDDAPDDTYVKDDNDDDTATEKDELLNVPAAYNTLSLVYRDPGTMRFIKYVSAAAPSSRWDIVMEYAVPPDEDDDGAEKNEETMEGEEEVDENSNEKEALNDGEDNDGVEDEYVDDAVEDGAQGGEEADDAENDIEATVTDEQPEEEMS